MSMRQEGTCSSLALNGPHIPSLEVEHFAAPKVDMLRLHNLVLFSHCRRRRNAASRWQVAMTTRNSFIVQSVIVFVVASGIGVSVIVLAVSQLHHWYLTGDLWVLTKSAQGPGWYTTFGEAPVLFALTFGMYLIYLGAGFVFFWIAIFGSRHDRKQRQARLASKPKPPPHPWLSRPKDRPKGPG